MKDRGQSSKLENRTSLPVALCHITSCLWPSLWGAGGLQPDSLTAPARAYPQIISFIFLSHVIDWPPRTIFQLPPASEDSVRRSIHPVSVPKLVLATLNYSYLVSVFMIEALNLTSKLLIQFFSQTSEAFVYLLL